MRRIQRRIRRPDRTHSSLAANRKEESCRTCREAEKAWAALDEKGITYGLVKDMDYQNIEKSNSDAAAELAKGYAQNFFQFATVTDSGSSVEEHMESFYYSYELNSIYEWLLQQSL